MRIEEEKLLDVSQEIAEDIKRASKRGGGVAFKKIITPESVRRARMEISRAEALEPKGEVENEQVEEAEEARRSGGFRMAAFLTTLLIVILSSTKFVHPPTTSGSYEPPSHAYESTDKVILMPPPSPLTSVKAKWFVASLTPVSSPPPTTSSNPVVVVVKEHKALAPVRRLANAILDDVINGGVKEAVRFVFISTVLNLGFGGILGNPISKTISKRLGVWLMKVGVAAKGKVVKWGVKVFKKGVKVFKTLK